MAGPVREGREAGLLQWKVKKSYGIGDLNVGHEGITSDTAKEERGVIHQDVKLETTDEVPTQAPVGLADLAGTHQRQDLAKERKEATNEEYQGGACDPRSPLGLVKPSRSYFIVGSELKNFTAPAVTQEDKEDYIADLGTSRWAWTRREFAHWLTHTSIAKFDGTGDAYTLAEWDSALKGYFRREQILNEAKRSALAIVTFRGKVERWWNAYMEQFPYRILSYAQLLEMMKTELVEKADPTTALQAWLQLEYRGKPGSISAADG